MPLFHQQSASLRQGFTLVEMMVVVGLIALILSMGIPSIIQLTRKDPMRQAISDIFEAVNAARAHAILKGVNAELRFQPKDYTFSVGASSGEPNQRGATASSTSLSLPQGLTGSFNGRFSDQLIIEMIDVNFQEYKDEAEAKVRFFPNGTCDECTIVLQWPEKQQYRKITLDIMTSHADMDIIR